MYILYMTHISLTYFNNFNSKYYRYTHTHTHTYMLNTDVYRVFQDEYGKNGYRIIYIKINKKERQTTFFRLLY